MNKIGFFGGSFNPITNAHINLIKKVIIKEKLDKVFFVPMGDFYVKKGLIPLSIRIEMIKMAIKDEEKIDILKISNTDKKTYAIDTFEKIDKLFPKAQRFFIMGSDNYQKISTWKDSEKLKTYNYIILDRQKENTKDISATLARTKIKNKEEVFDLVPAPVIEYIDKNNLYK